MQQPTTALQPPQLRPSLHLPLQPVGHQLARGRLPDPLRPPSLQPHQPPLPPLPATRLTTGSCWISTPCRLLLQGALQRPPLQLDGEISWLRPQPLPMETLKLSWQVKSLLMPLQPPPPPLPLLLQLPRPQLLQLSQSPPRYPSLLLPPPQPQTSTFSEMRLHLPQETVLLPWLRALLLMHLLDLTPSLQLRGVQTLLQSWTCSQ
ncbi:ABI gene family member 3-like [Melanotaenia boesemani]|uniref:ABI gene family member 3-like n=1 Tax=Melanotaenia boesemani TaxID=1250792 RepID=UPI001C03C261|nr:ABI gene family member 3-like [Melanotaenia boesemani]